MRRFALACALAAPAAALVLNQEPTFDEIGPLIARSCAPCHSPGGPAPFNLRTYEEVKRRAERVGVNVASKAMPPCQITSDFGAFASLPGLTTEEVVAIRRWATSGANDGSVIQSLAKPVEFSWRLGKPHQVLQSNLISVPAEGGVHWVFTKLSFPRGGKLRGFQLKPSDTKTIRQAVIGWAPTGLAPMSGVTAFDKSVKQIGAWAFGYYTWRLPKGAAVEVPPGSELHVMLQCQAIGRSGDASFELGLYFEKRPRSLVRMTILEKKGFTIEVGEKPTLVAEQILPVDAKITALLPEFRYACENMKLSAHLPTGESKVLAAGRWDVYWTGAYNFTEPVKLPAGTTLRLSAYYNNGFEASHGPDVRVPIKNGVGLQDELFKTTVQYMPD